MPSPIVRGGWTGDRAHFGINEPERRRTRANVRPVEARDGDNGGAIETCAGTTKTMNLLVRTESQRFLGRDGITRRLCEAGSMRIGAGNRVFSSPMTYSVIYIYGADMIHNHLAI